MKQRVTFGPKEKRRNQRRPVALTATLGGVSVDLFDLSFTGTGGRIVGFDEASELPFEEGAVAMLEFSCPDGHRVVLKAAIQRLDRTTGELGATFSTLGDRDFRAIEKLMFPPRHRT